MNNIQRITSFSVDHDKLTLEVWTNGVITAQEAVSLAAKILTGEADIAAMPIEYAPATPKYNPTICQALGLTAPEGYEALN